MENNNQLLRFTTAGSVDDGKSTLIGRLLYDSKSIFEDQLDAIAKTSEQKGHEGVDLALFTDGLRDEREQGITIDVAYRYFTTPKRKFIIADTPGHIQYTRNMVTGASTANAALILVDARHGVIEQTRRHSFIASLLQIPHVIVCINKMDLVEYKEEAYTKIQDQFDAIKNQLNLKDIRFIPISALKGDNVVNPSKQMDWYKGNTLLDTLETIDIQNDYNLEDPRLPVQTVIRPQSEEFRDFRGFAGRIASGAFKVGDSIKALPSGKSSTIKSITTLDAELESAQVPQSVVMTLNDEIDIARGDTIVSDQKEVKTTNQVDAMICWLDEEKAIPRAKYLLKQGSNDVLALIKKVDYKVDMETLNQNDQPDGIGMNDICKVQIKTNKPIVKDSYSVNRKTGSFILIEESTNETVAAGMII